jgi:hypothetical protein
MTGLLSDRIGTMVSGAVRDLAFALLGESAIATLQASGALGVTLLVLGFIGAALGTVAGLRRLATASDRRA